MIDYPDQEGDRIAVPGVPDDIKFLGGSIDNVAHWAKKTYDALRRQESPNPSVINLNPGIIYSTTVRMRSYALVFSGGTAGDVMGLKIGSAVSWDWIVPTQPTIVYFPMPLPLYAGIDSQVVDVTTPAAVNWRCRVLAYVELEDGNS